LLRRRRRVGEVEGECVEGSSAEFAPAGGDWALGVHGAGFEVADENFGSFAAEGLVGLVAVGFGGEGGIERRLGLVDLVEDAHAGETGPVVVVDAGAGADAGDGVAWAYAEIVEGVGGAEGVAVVPSSRIFDEDEIAAKLTYDAGGFSDGKEAE
jgi:hypothetical protein